MLGEMLQTYTTHLAHWKRGVWSVPANFELFLRDENMQNYTDYVEACNHYGVEVVPFAIFKDLDPQAGNYMGHLQTTPEGQRMRYDVFINAFKANPEMYDHPYQKFVQACRAIESSYP